MFLLDDHEIVRRGLRDLLEAEGDIVVVGEASTEQSGAPVCRLDPDVAVLDVRLRRATGSRPAGRSALATPARPA